MRVPMLSGRVSATDRLSWWFRPDGGRPRSLGQLLRADGDLVRRGGRAVAGWSRPRLREPPGRRAALRLLLAEPDEEMMDSDAEAVVTCLYDFVHAVGRGDVVTAVEECVAPDYHAMEDDVEVDRDALAAQLHAQLDRLRGWEIDVSLVEIPEPILHPDGDPRLHGVPDRGHQGRSSTDRPPPPVGGVPSGARSTLADRRTEPGLRRREGVLARSPGARPARGGTAGRDVVALPLLSHAAADQPKQHALRPAAHPRPAVARPALGGSRPRAHVGEPSPPADARSRQPARDFRAPPADRSSRSPERTSRPRTSAPTRRRLPSSSVRASASSWCWDRRSGSGTRSSRSRWPSGSSGRTRLLT